MYREIEKDLLHWKKSKVRKPLLLRGARQVGKSYIIEKFGKEHFEDLVILDFEFYPTYCNFFETLDPKKILSAIEVHFNKKIHPKKTLIFFDEIQACPNAIMALRYFKEKTPEYAIIGAGSLLEFALKEKKFKMPVGRVQYLYLKPLRFFEFLRALNHDLLLDQLINVSHNTPIDKSIHELALEQIRKYIALGGMPDVIQTYLSTENLLECQHTQTSILKTYRDDFGKYAKNTEQKYLKLLYEKAPGLVAKWFKYNKVCPDTDIRSLKNALNLLYDANILYRVFSTSASGLPLISQINEKKFKILFLDTGLCHRAFHLDLKRIFSEDLLLINQGALVKQYVGQELLATFDRFDPQPLFFWVREKTGSSAEVDYVLCIDEHIIPIEVKSGKTGKLRSLKIFMEEKESPLGIRISKAPLSFEKNILSIPFYLIDLLPALVRNILN